MGDLLAPFILETSNAEDAEESANSFFLPAARFAGGVADFLDAAAPAFDF
jgi:hypothetical protein